MTWKVALPMYNVSDAVTCGYDLLLDALIGILQRNGWHEPIEKVHAPADLPGFWQRPDLLLSQTCGYPYMTRFQGRVHLLATPCFDFSGCRGADYSSVIVVRADSGIGTLEDARGGVAAVNEMDSNSGMNLLRHAVAPLARDGRFFRDVRISGAHLASLAMLRDGNADIAAIDCITYAYVQQHRPETVEALRILQFTAWTPGLPFIASSTLTDERLRRLHAALSELAECHADLLQPLHITRFAHCSDADYAKVLRLEREAQSLGYPCLA